MQHTRERLIFRGAQPLPHLITAWLFELRAISAAIAPFNRCMRASIKLLDAKPSSSKANPNSLAMKMLLFISSRTDPPPPVRLLLSDPPDPLERAVMLPPPLPLSIVKISVWGREEEASVASPAPACCAENSSSTCMAAEAAASSASRCALPPSNALRMTFGALYLVQSIIVTVGICGRSMGQRGRSHIARVEDESPVAEISAWNRPLLVSEAQALKQLQLFRLRALDPIVNFGQLRLVARHKEGVKAELQPVRQLHAFAAHVEADAESKHKE